MRTALAIAVAVLVAGAPTSSTLAETIRARVVDGPNVANVNVVEPAAPMSAVPGEDRPISGELWGGLGSIGGDVTYEIGGAYSDSTGSGHVNSPLSRLKWPVDVLSVTVGGSLNLARFWELTGRWSGSLSSDAGKLEDSDWGNPNNPWVKTTYSLSDTDFDGMTSDIGIRCWALNWVWDRYTSYSIGFGGGWIYQDFRWEASNTDQWYPADPQLGHDWYPGAVGSYKTKVNMPYIETACAMRMPWISFFGSFGYSPSAQVKDEDDHKIRSILANTDAKGDAVKLTLQGRCDYNQYVFALIRADMIAYDVSGTERDVTYAGADAGDSWSIHHEVSSVQDNFTIAIGVKF